MPAQSTTIASELSGSYESRFENQWLPELATSGFTQISNHFLQIYSDLPVPISHGEAMLIIHLFQFKWDEKAPFPRYSKLANLMGLSEKSVRRLAKSLETKGYLNRESRVGRSNRFHFDGLLKALKSTIAPSSRDRKRAISTPFADDDIF